MRNKFFPNVDNLENRTVLSILKLPPLVPIKVPQPTVIVQPPKPTIPKPPATKPPILHPPLPKPPIHHKSVTGHFPLKPTTGVIKPTRPLPGIPTGGNVPPSVGQLGNLDITISEGVDPGSYTVELHVTMNRAHLTSITGAIHVEVFYLSGLRQYFDLPVAAFPNSTKYDYFSTTFHAKPGALVNAGFIGGGTYGSTLADRGGFYILGTIEYKFLT